MSDCLIPICTRFFPKMHHVKPAFSSGEFRCFGLNATVLQHTLVGRIFQAGMVADNAFVEALFL